MGKDQQNVPSTLVNAHFLIYFGQKVWLRPKYLSTSKLTGFPNSRYSLFVPFQPKALVAIPMPKFPLFFTSTFHSSILFLESYGGDGRCVNGRLTDDVPEVRHRAGPGPACMGRCPKCLERTGRGYPPPLRRDVRGMGYQGY